MSISPIVLVWNHVVVQISPCVCFIDLGNRADVAPPPFMVFV